MNSTTVPKEKTQNGVLNHIELYQGPPPDEDEERYNVGAYHPLDGDLKTQAGTSSTWLAAWNVANCIQGAGILSLPYAVKEGGYAAIITHLMLTAFGCYTCKILANCLYETETNEDGTTRQVRVRSSYADIGDACWKNWGGRFINYVQLIDLIAVAALYLELPGFLMTDAFPNAGISQLAWTVITAFVVLPSIFLRTLTMIAWLSMLAVVAYFVMAACVVGYGISIATEWKAVSWQHFTLETFMVSFGLTLFHYDTVYAAIPSVEESMKHRNKFNVMINWTFVWLTVFNLLYGIMAYLTFGENTAELITDSLPRGPYHIVNLLVVMKALLTYPLMIFMIIHYIELIRFHFLPPCYGVTAERLPGTWAMVFRTVLVVFTLFLAIVVPHFRHFMGFIGAVMTPFVAYIIPCGCHLKLKHKELRYWEIALEIVIIFVAIVGGTLAVIFASKQLVEAYIP
uniref:Vesicular inhibitory amino acid transporter-like n=1 Tax=Saccoglossus kowalevskii TaxID=10224 RepID=A0ABM0LUV2_SACKO|nr:PREDICTED: vesicular inhibitory amino acid transporter-like [Saccoglossus kowalevskii]